MARSPLEPLTMTGRGVRVLDRARDRSAARIDPLWTAVTLVVVLFVVLALLFLGFG